MWFTKQGLMTEKIFGTGREYFLGAQPTNCINEEISCLYQISWHVVQKKNFSKHKFPHVSYKAQQVGRGGSALGDPNFV